MKTFSISVDCEDLRKGERTDYNLYDCKVGDKSFGIPKLIEIFDAQDVTATFFVDVYNVHKQITMESLKLLCRDIVRHGHDIGLHTHPPKSRSKAAHLFDSPVGYLADLDHQEQFQLLDEGKKTLEDWTGTEVTTHRGGSYSVNEDSFDSLVRLGFTTDASIFWPALDYAFIPAAQKNLLNPFSYGDLVEVPVSCFLSSLKVGKRLALFKKLDINWSTTREIMSAQAKIRSHVDLFLHSYTVFDIKRTKAHHFFLKSLIETLKALKQQRKNLRLHQVKASDDVQSVPELPAYLAFLSLGSLQHMVFPKLNVRKIKAHLQRSKLTLPSSAE